MQVHDFDTFLKETRGKFFAVEFLKLTKEERHMTCRVGVKRHIKGTGRTPSPKVRIVWDSVKQQYRSIKPETIRFAKCGKLVYVNQDILF